jgi:hypothetical protein
LPYACDRHRLRARLEGLPAEALAADLVECMVRADHEGIGLAIPVRRRRGAAFQRYLAARSQAAIAPLSAALACRVVSAHVPECWIPDVPLQAELDRLLDAYGGGRCANLRLVAPIPGGGAWAARLGGDGLRAIAALDPGSPCAPALLQWPDGIAAAVLWHHGGQLRAFGTAFPATGQPIDPTALLAAHVIPRALPPMSWFRRLLRWMHRLRGAGA